ncbi:hypothetical protein HID58_053845 [Brassica napus]|uniref:UBC core domain-containing protein n=1 Tax=Brassica napus TaxID=3708 RepID=A0ABQ8AFT9_BRANA|nr:hypothetical protein HID58_053845 [Brassica napus]
MQDQEMPICDTQYMCRAGEIIKTSVPLEPPFVIHVTCAIKDRSMKPEIVYTTLTPNKGTTPGAMQNGGVLDNNNVDNKNKGKAIQLGSLSEDDHQLEESASEGYDTTHNDESDPGSSPQSDSLLDPDALIYEDDSDQYGYEMELEEEEEEEADEYVSKYQALFDAKEKELPAGVEVTMDWLPNSKSSGSNKSSREEHGIKPEATGSAKKPKKLPHNSKGVIPNSAYALPQIYLDPHAPVPAPAVPAPASSTVLLPTQNKPKGIYNARPGVQEVISDSNTCRVKRNMDDYLGKFVFFKRFDIVEDLVDHQYASRGTSSKKHSKEWAKRIQEEWRTLENDLPEMIFVRAYESRMDLLRAVIIGADGTPYHDGLFFFDIFFPDTYPSVPPVVHYHSGGLRINPNLYNSGKVCLSLLGTWSGAASQMWIPTKSTMLQYFEDFSYGHFFSCAHDVLKACNAYRNGAPVASLEFILLGVLGLEPEEEDKPSETKVAESSRRMIFVRAYESRMDLLRAVIIGADGTPYHDGLFFFDIFFPDTYPSVPPVVHYHSGGLGINPNLYGCGKVCLSLLGTWSGSSKEKWLPNKSTMLQVLVSIQGLILNEKPYFNEPGLARTSGSPSGESRSKAYSESIFLLSLKIWFTTRGDHPSCAHDVLKACDAYRDGAPVASLEFILLGVLGLEPGEEDKPSETKVAESSSSSRRKRGRVSLK